MRIRRDRDRASRRGRRAEPIRFEICCGAECDGECRRRAVQDRVARWAPLPIRLG